MFRYQLGPSFEFIVNALVAFGPSDACQRCAFGKACLREETCCEVLVASPRVAENSPAKSSNPANENPAVPLRKILDLCVHACI